MKLKHIAEKFNSTAYDKYLTEHIYNVMCAYELLTHNNVFEYSEKIRKQISNHDISKYSSEEYNAYGEYFYGDKKNTLHKDDSDFKYAWLNHQHLNGHHWQHWLLKEDDSDKIEALDIPDNYIQEMLCDWMAFSISKNDIAELFKWYNENKSKQIMTDKTRKAVEAYLDKIKSANIDLSKSR